MTRAILALVLGSTVVIMTTTRCYGGDLEIEVRGVKSDEGRLMIGLYDSEETFLNPKHLVAGVKLRLPTIAAEREAMRITLHNLPHGRYAVSAYHDVDGDGELDRNSLGMPTEAQGCSNGATGFLGPPKYKDAAFAIGDEPVHKIIEVR